MDNLIAEASTRRAMDMSEAAAMHTRMLVVARTASERSHEKLMSSKTGIQRRGPLGRKIISHVRSALAPVLLNEKGNKRQHVFVYLSYDDKMALDDQLMVSVMVYDKKKVSVTNEATLGIVISRHASERIMQYFRVREFDTLDEILGGCYNALVNGVMSNLDEVDEAVEVPIRLDNIELGHFIVEPHRDDMKDGKRLIVVKTWIGGRSYTPAQRDHVRVKRGLEVLG